MQTTRIIKNKKGVTLIELLIALIISALLIAGIYNTFIGQQKTYIVQEQVVDMQQNLRAGINKMMREIRMAGFGGLEGVLNNGGVNGFTQPITANQTTITIIGGFKQIRNTNGDPITVDSASGNTVILNNTPELKEFDSAAKRFISIGGVESSKFQIDGKVLTLEKKLKYNHPKGTPIFKIQAITYSVGQSGGKPSLLRNENTEEGNQPLADNIENIQFEYFDENGNPLAFPISDPKLIRMVRVTVTARTDRLDPDFKSGDGYRRRTITSNIYVRNMEFYQEF